MTDNINDYFTSVSGKVVTPSGKQGNIVEEVTSGIKQISTDHGNIHDKLAYTAFNKFTLAAAASGFLEITVPAGKYIHFKPVTFQSDGPKITVQIIEAPTLTTGSTLVTAANRNRVGTPPISVLTIKNNPTNVSGGTIVDQDYIGGGTSTGGQGVSGGMATNDNEWVLKPQTLYAIKVTNGGSGSADVNIKLFWYEESAG